MLYAAMTFWLLVVIFAAWGTIRLYTGIVPPRIVNSVLLPGTFVAQAGRVLGQLVTGGTINDTSRTTIYQGDVLATGDVTGSFSIDIHSNAAGTTAWTCGTINGEDHAEGACY